MLDFVRGLVRPYLAFAIPTTVLALAVYLAVKFADAEIARTVVTIVVTSASLIIGFYFGERANKPKEDK